MRYLFLLTMTALLSACAWFDNPDPIGRGYAYYNQEYKTPPGPTPDSLGYDYTPEVNQKIVAEWRAAAADLLDALENKTQMKNNVYVVPAPRMNALFATFDHVLRVELEKRGYVIARLPSGGEPITYDAVSPDGKGLGLLWTGEESSAPARFDGKVETRKFILSLSYGQPAKATARSQYDMPESGYFLIDQILRTSVPLEEKGLQK